MGSRQLDKPEWQGFCDRLSRGSLAGGSMGETASLVVNEEVVAEWVPLLGVAYDRPSDAFDIILDGLEHRVRAPRLFYVDEGPRGVAALEIIDGANLRHTLKMSHPVKPLGDCRTKR
jgi:Family of unknown function (DUF5335)